MNSVNEVPSSGDKTTKIVAGFALIYDLWNGRSTPELEMLYEQPELKALQRIHSVLRSSDDYRDREAAIWLMLVLDVPEPQLDLQDIVNELQEMEFIIRRLISRANETWQADFNVWMDYLANAAIGLRDGFWLDAKMDLNRALSLAMGQGIMRIPSTSGIAHEVFLLQDETRRLFETIRDIPVRLNLPKERLDLVLDIQTLLIEAIAYQRTEKETRSETLDQAVHDINLALRQAMRESEKERSVMEQLELVSSRIQTGMENQASEAVVRALQQLRDRAKAIAQILP